ALGPHRAQALAAALPERYFASTDPRRALLHARALERADKGRLVGAVRQRRAESFTEITLCAPDRPGLLALFAGVLAAHRVTILRARILSTQDGYALDVFDVLGPAGQLVDRARWRATRADLLRALSGSLTVAELLAKRRPGSVLARPLPEVATR